MRVAFDIDDTLWKIVPDGTDDYGNLRGKQVPDYDLIQVLRWFHANGDDVYVWSAGGIDYAQTIVNKLGLDSIVKVITKQSHWNIDLSFDDMEVDLGTVNCQVKRTPIA